MHCWIGKYKLGNQSVLDITIPVFLPDVVNKSE